MKFELSSYVLLVRVEPKKLTGFIETLPVSIVRILGSSDVFLPMDASVWRSSSLCGGLRCQLLSSLAKPGNLTLLQSPMAQFPADCQAVPVFAHHLVHFETGMSAWAQLAPNYWRIVVMLGKT